MSSYEGLGSLVAEIRQASENITQADARVNQRIDGIEASVNELFRTTQRPGAERADDASFERKDARELCILKHDLDVPKNDGHAPAYEPSPAEVDAALMHRKALKSLFRHGNLDRLDNLEKKSLTSFSFGTNQFILAPQMSDRVLSCLVDPTDIAGLMGQETTSSGSLKFLIDNARMLDAAWACEASCFANNPNPDLAEGLGELEIKVETLRLRRERFVAGRELQHRGLGLAQGSERLPQRHQQRNHHR